jgi:hypothetical protein
LVQKAENEFVWPFDYLKYRFNDFTKVVVQVDQKADSEFSRPFAYLKLQFRDLVQIDAQEAENEFLWQINLLKHRFIELHQCRFLRRPKGS